MANIATYLRELEARLAPALDAQVLQERLTEAENHLRDRAQEFEEVGLPPHEAETHAVAAFGEVEEYVEDVPSTALKREFVRKEEPSRDIALQLAWSLLALGLLATLAMNVLPFFWATFAAAAVVGLAALGGRAIPLARLAHLSLAATLGLAVVLVSAYVPGRGLASPMHRDEMAARVGLGQGPAAKKYASFTTEQRMAHEGRLGQNSEGRFLAPLDAQGGWTYHTTMQESQRAWSQYGPVAAVNLRNEAEVEVGSPYGDAYPGSRSYPLLRDAALFGALLMTLLAGFQSLGMAGRSGLLALRRPRSLPSDGLWDRR